MAEQHVNYLLIGGGMASAHAAAELRRQGDEGTVMLVGREPEPPYERPPLTKEYLRGESGRDAAYVQPTSWYEDNAVELRTRTNVMSLDPEGKTASLQGGETVQFDKCLLATGANVNILRPEGASLEGIHYIRAFGNSDAVRAEASKAGRVVLIGGSYIACEAAASLRSMGIDCAMVMMEQVVLENTFGADVGRYFDDVLTSHGVEIYRGESLSAFEGDGRVDAVITESGTRIPCDLVVVGAGVKPDTMLASRSGLDVGDGIICDESLRTSAPDIFAAGDCCSYQSVIHGRRLRVEHWDVALNQGLHAAVGMMGNIAPYEAVPYFFSDFADWASLEYVGPAADWDQVVVRGALSDGEFSAWYLADRKVQGALSVGRSEDLAIARAYLAAGERLGIDDNQLSDPQAELPDPGA